MDFDAVAFRFVAQLWEEKNEFSMFEDSKFHKDLGRPEFDATHGDIEEGDERK